VQGIEQDKKTPEDKENIVSLLSKISKSISKEVDNINLIIAEMLFWSVVFFIVTGKFWIELYSESRYLNLNRMMNIVVDNYLALSIGSIILILPAMFRQVFGCTPLAWIKLMFKQKFILFNNEEGKVVDKSDDKSDKDNEDDEIKKLTSIFSKFKSENSTVMVLLKENVESSRKIAIALYRRSGFFLLVGGIIAMLGVLLFYTLNLNFVVVDGDTVKSLLSMLPRTGIFLFVEVIAMFFLRQYRVAMDEYRYYETIKRRREEVLILYKMVKESDKYFMPDIYIKLDAFFSDSNKLIKKDICSVGQSTKYDTDLIDAIVGIVVKNIKK